MLQQLKLLLTSKKNISGSPYRRSAPSQSFSCSSTQKIHYCCCCCCSCYHSQYKLSGLYSIADWQHSNRSIVLRYKRYTTAAVIVVVIFLKTAFLDCTQSTIGNIPIVQLSLDIKEFQARIICKCAHDAVISLLCYL